MRMKTKSDKLKFAGFVGCLVLIALLINYFFGFSGAPRSTPPAITQESSSSPASAQVLARVDNNAAERAQFIARYLNSSPARQSGTKLIASAAVDEAGKLNLALSSALAQRLKGAGINILPLFFKPEFVSGGLFDDAFNGSSEPIKDLDLAASLDAFVLARQQVQYSTNPTLENVITASMQLEIMARSVAGSESTKTWKFSATGAGFTQADARLQAEERLIKQIASDPKLSLTAILSTNPN